MGINPPAWSVAPARAPLYYLVLNVVLLINAESLAALSDPSSWDIGGVALILIPLDSVPHQIATWRHCRDFPGIERFVLSGVPSTDETADFQG